MKNKTCLLIYPLAIIGVLFILANSCKKKDDNNNPTLSRPVPVLTTTAITDITSTTANSGGNITSVGGSSVTVSGVCWGTSSNPTTANSKTTDGTGSGSFASAITGLDANTTYYVRAYATNSSGTGYGSSMSFTTLSSFGSVPVLTTTATSGITSTSASSGGNIISDGGSSITVSGICWGTSSNPTTANSKTTDGNLSGTFTSAITGLNPNTTYFIRAYASNNAGTGYGSSMSFTTLPPLGSLAVLTTTAVSNITTTTASSGGNITSDGGSIVTVSGVCWGISSNPTTANNITTDGTGSGSFSSSITGLIANTTYHVRAYATNSAGTAYGNDVSFITQQPNTTVTDIDGNVYQTVTIGTQTWMVENLTTTRYRDGSSIPNVPDAASWPGQSAGAYCDYDNSPINSTVYGKLYNWYAVIDSRNIAPIGWHVPSDADWRTLTDYLGGVSVAGGKLKETGYSHWANPNTDATNESGFTALPGGCRGSGGAFFYNGSYGYWWSTTEDFTVYAYFRNVGFDVSSVFRNFNEKAGGFSIRCLRD